MSTLNELLDKARETCGASSDMALAARLDKSRALVSAWRKGEKLVQDDDVARLAELAKVDPGSWLVAIRAEQSTGVAHRYWVNLARQLGVAATVAAVTLIGFPAPADAASLNAGQTMHYANLRKLARKLLDRWVLGNRHGSTPVLA